jgi:catechol 2,3-dioxygenase-like lactoylglutathione lyase family enzyme
MPLSEVHHVAVIVADLERSANFYEKGLGYRKTLSGTVGSPPVWRALRMPEGTMGRMQYMQGPSQLGQLELIEWNDGSESPARTDFRQVGYYLMSFQVPDEELDELYQRIEETGGHCLGEPVKVLIDNYGYIQAFAATDPDGNLLDFVVLPSQEAVRAYRGSGRR